MSQIVESSRNGRTILWWGRGDADYSRNRIVRKAMTSLGWTILDYRPRWWVLGSLEAKLRRVPRPALVWVPCFRQRDVASACRWARSQGVPVIFDPLISAYDKQVFERQKFEEGSAPARKLLAWERSLFSLPQIIVADTSLHADYFAEAMGVSREKLHIIPVGAEADLFEPSPVAPADSGVVEVLFYGSFIELQGPEVIVEAARQCPIARWTLLGDGPLLERCMKAAMGLHQIRFEPRVSFESLPSRIAAAHILLGVFSESDKAGRVVPNKVYQSLACGRPVITRESAAYPAMPQGWQQRDDGSVGIFFVPPANPTALAAQVSALARRPKLLASQGCAARELYEKTMSPKFVYEAVQHVLSRVGAG